MVAAAFARIGNAAALSAALLVSAMEPSAADCSVTVAGPAQGRSWAERRREILARYGVSRPGTAALYLSATANPVSSPCGALLARRADVRYRIALIAPTWRLYGAMISAAAARHGVPAELILAAIVEESGGKARAVAVYPGYVSDAATPGKISLGLGQMLLSTARQLTSNPAIDRAALFDPATAIDLVARYFARFYRTTGFDPRLAASAYNAGSVRPAGAGERWTPSNPQYVARFAAVFEASVAYLARRPDRPPQSFAALLELQ